MTSAGRLNVTFLGSSLLTPSTTIFNHDRWYHVLLKSSTPNNLNLYVNGVSLQSGTYSYSSPVSLSPLRFAGDCSAPTAPYGMRLADFRIGPNAFTSTNYPLSLTSPALRSASDIYVTFSEGTGLPTGYTSTGVTNWSPFNVPSCSSTSLQVRIKSLPNSLKGTLYQTSDGVTKGALISVNDTVTDSKYRVIYDIAPQALDIFGSALFDSFNYSAYDGLFESLPGVVSLNVSATPDFARAQNLNYTVAEDTVLNITLAPSSPDITTLVATISSLPLRGGLYTDYLLTNPINTVPFNISSPYKVFFLPAFNENDSPYTTFEYYATPTNGKLSSLATVVINVTAVDDLPIASDGVYTFTQSVSGTNVTFDLSCIDPDGGNTALSFVLWSLPPAANGTITLTNGTAVSIGKLYATNRFKIWIPVGFSGLNATRFRFGCYGGGAYSSNNATAYFSIVSFNYPPQAFNDSYVIVQNSTLYLCLRGNDTDHTPLATVQYQIGALPTNGNLFSNTSGALSTGSIVTAPCIRYTPFLYTWQRWYQPYGDYFTFRTYDGDKYSPWADIYINISAIAQSLLPPLAQPINITVREDTPTFSFNLLGSDPNHPEDNHVYDIASPPTGITFNATSGVANYTAPSDFVGTISFTYTYSDSDTGVSSAPALVFITVTAVEDPPVALNISASCTEDALCPILMYNSTAISFTDPDNDVLRALVTSLPIFGTLYSGSIRITYVPFPLPGNSSGTIALNYLATEEVSGDWFSYQVTDDRGGVSSFAYVDITISAVLDPPIAISQYGLVTYQNTPLQIDFVGSKTDVDINTFGFFSTTSSSGDLYSDSDCTSPVGSSITLSPSDPLTYTAYYCPNQDVVTRVESPVFFQFDVADTQPTPVHSAKANITIFILAVNQKPEAYDMSLSMNEGSILIIDLNATDLETPSELIATITSLPSASEAILYHDLEGNEPIVVGDDSSLRVFLKSIPNAMTASPNIGLNFSVSFGYHVKDPQGLQSSPPDNTVTVTINLIDDPPVPTSQHYDFFQSSVNNPITLTGTDTDSPLSSLRFQISSLPAKGTLKGTILASTITLTSANLFTYLDTPTLTYTPVSTQLGSPYTSFTFILSDSDGVFSTVNGTIQISIRPKDYPPTALPDAVTVVEGASKLLTLKGVDDYTPTSLLVFTIRSLPLFGKLFQADGAPITSFPTILTYGNLVTYVSADPSSTFTSFTFSVRDELGQNSTTVTESITITQIKHAPIAYGQTLSLDVGSASSITVSLNASDPDGDPLTYTLLYFPSYGTFTDSAVPLTPTGPVNLSGTDFTFTPDSFLGTLAIRFSVTDNSALNSNEALVYITVTGPNQPPTVANVVVNCYEDETVPLFFNATDPDSPLSLIRFNISTGSFSPSTLPVLWYTINVIPTQQVTSFPTFVDGGTSSSQGSYDNNYLLFEASPPDSPAASLFFYYSAFSNSQYSTSTGTYTVNIIPKDDPPVAFGSYAKVVDGLPPFVTFPAAGGTASYYQFTLSGFDLEGDTLSYCISSDLFDPYVNSTGLGWLVQDDGFFNSTITVPTGGCAALVANSVIYVAPPGKFVLGDRPFAAFGVKAFDGLLYSPEVLNRIFLASQPHNPNITDLHVSILEDERFKWIPNITDPDIASRPPTVTVLSVPQFPSLGALYQNLNGLLPGDVINTVPTNLIRNGIYIPIPDASGFSVSWDWFVTDETGLNSSIATVYLDIIPVDDPPIARDSNYQVILNRFVEFSLGFLVSDVDSTNLTIEILAVPSTGITYMVYNQSDPYANPILCCGESCLNQTVNNCTFTPFVLNVPNGTLRFTPGLNATEPSSGAFATVIWRAFDGQLYSDNATAQIDLVRNQPPVADSESFFTLEDHPLTFALSGTDPEGDPTTAWLLSLPNRGTVYQFDQTPFIQPNCSDCGFVTQQVTDPLKRVYFVPALYDSSTNTTNGNVTDVSVYTSFTFELRDAEFSSNQGLVTLYVIELPYPPIANNISISMREQDRKTLTFDAFAPNGEDLTYRFLVLASEGSTWQTLNDLNPVGPILNPAEMPALVISSSGSFIYESPANPGNKPTNFTFAYDALILDRTNRSAILMQSDIAYMNIEVTPVNDPPIAFDQTLTIEEDGSIVITLQGFDPDDGAVITPTIQDIPPLGSLYQYGNISDVSSLDRIITPFTPVQDPKYRVIFFPSPNDNGVPYTQFTFIFNDGEYDSPPGRVIINVLPVNDPPIAKVPRAQRAYSGSDLIINVGGEDLDTTSGAPSTLFAYIVNAFEAKFLASGSELYQAVPVHLGRDELNFTATITRGDLISQNCTVLTDPNRRVILNPRLAANNTEGRDTLSFVVQFSDGLLFSPTATISVLVQKPKAELPSAYDSNTGNIVGPIVAAACALIALGIIMFIIWYRNNRMGDDEDYIKLDLFDSEEPDEPEVAIEDEEDTMKSRGNLEKLILDPKYQVLNGLLNAIDVTEYDALAKVLVDVFEYHQCTLQMLKYFITAEVEGASSAGTLFRANSIASKMMTAYTKMIGNEYLILTLKTPIDTIIKKDNAMEVDPKKLKPGESRKANMRLLLLACQNFLDWIVSSANNAPMPFRILSNHLFYSVEKKFPANKHIAVGGFLFLRFFCPAIISPEGFKVIATPPPPPARRALVLIAKALQNLSNGVLFGKKEAYMVDVNEFISRNMEPLKTYFDSMVSLPGQYGKVPSMEIPEDRLATGLQVIHKYLWDFKDKVIDVLEGKDGTHSERTDSHSHSTSRSGRSKGTGTKGSSKGTSGRTSSHGSSRADNRSGSERSRSGSQLHQPHFGDDSVTEMSDESDMDSFADEGNINIDAANNIFVGEDGVEYILAPDEQLSDDDEILFDEDPNFANAFTVEEVGTDTAREMGIPLDEFTNVDELSLEEAWQNALSPIDITKEATPDGFNANGEVTDPVLALKYVLNELGPPE